MASRAPDQDFFAHPIPATHPVATGFDTGGLVHHVWELKMLWIVMGLFGAAFVLVELGALSVWVKLMSFALVVVGCVAALGLGVFLWRRLMRRA